MKSLSLTILLLFVFSLLITGCEEYTPTEPEEYEYTEYEPPTLYPESYGETKRKPEEKSSEEPRGDEPEWGKIKEEPKEEEPKPSKPEEPKPEPEEEPPVYSCKVKVIDEISGKPISGAYVFIIYGGIMKEDQRLQRFETNADGEVNLVDNKIHLWGWYVEILEVGANFYEKKGSEKEPIFKKTFLHHEGDKITVTVKLRPKEFTYCFAVKVLDDLTHKPVENAKVTFRIISADGKTSTKTLQTSSKGKCELEGSSIGVVNISVLKVEADGYKATSRMPLYEKKFEPADIEHSEEVTVFLQGESSVYEWSVEVVVTRKDNGKPIPGAKILLDVFVWDKAFQKEWGNLKEKDDAKVKNKIAGVHRTNVNGVWSVRGVAKKGKIYIIYLLHVEAVGFKTVSVNLVAAAWSWPGPPGDFIDRGIISSEKPNLTLSVTLEVKN